MQNSGTGGPRKFGLLRRLVVVISATAMLTAMSASCSGGGGDESSAPPAELGFSEDEPGDGPVEIEWFVGLGTGSRVEQVKAQEDLADAFNASQNEIELVIELVDNLVAFDVLEQRIADGDSPDIVGPVGLRGGSAFQGQFLNLDPYIEASSLDLADYDEEQVNVWREDDGSLTALPFGVFPSFLFYNKDLFEQAGIAPPPHKFGDLYEGKEWNMEALYDLSLQLTFDADGYSALDPEFDPDQIVQWGFHHQYISDPRANGTFFGSGNIVADDGTAQIPDAWLAGWKWYHRLIWEGRGAPNTYETDSDLLAHGNSFNSGNIAIAFSHLWYTGNLRDENDEPQTFFDLAVVPSFEGNVTSKVHADTFRIFETSEHPAEAFKVLEFLLGPAEPELLQIYGSFPARHDLLADFLAELAATFPEDVDWSVAEASLAYPDIPSHEGYMPNYLRAEDRLTQFSDEMVSDPDMDISTAASALQEDLTEIFAGTPGPTG